METLANHELREKRAELTRVPQNDYFPHVSGKDLAGGFYDRLDKVQGQLNTFYASGLNGYETVEFALRAGRDVVEHYMK